MRLATLLLLAAAAAPIPTQTSAQTPPQPVAQAPSPSPVPSPFDPLTFLLGTWTAHTNASGASHADSSGEYTFHTDLNGTAIVRTTTADTCVAPQAFDCQHHDLLTIYREADSATLRALYLDNEGHTIHYTLSFPAPNTAIFLSSGPRLQFRLLYHLEDNVMTGKFQFAPPGSKAFKSYLEWSGGHPAPRDQASRSSFHSSIEALRGSTRILLVFAPSSRDPQFQQQLADFKAHQHGTTDRLLLLVPVLGTWSPVDSQLYDQNLPFSADQEQQYARTRFKVAPTAFTVVLVGTDGGEKLRSRTPVPAQRLFDTIDAMPNRQQEMHNRGKEQQTR